MHLLTSITLRAFVRFDDQEHGFVAARGDWSQPKVAEAATKAIGLLTDFFKANLQ